MKHTCLILCLLMLAGAATAQTKAKTMDLGNIISDSTSINKDLGSKLGLGSIHASSSIIEIRLYSNIGFPGTQCVVLQYDKTWKATKYKLNGKDEVVTSALKPAVGIEALAKTLIGSNVFSLPTQSAINSGRNMLDLTDNEILSIQVNMSDSPCYYLQFKVSTSSREYKYCDPKAYAAFYKGQHEYTDFANILKAFARLEVK